MKKIEAIIKPFRLDEVRGVLLSHGIGLTATEVRMPEQAQGVDFPFSAIPMPKVKVESVLDETQHNIDEIIAEIMQAAATGRDGDGEIRVLAVDTVVHIRTGQVTGTPLAKLAAG